MAESILADARIFGCCVIMGFLFSFLYDQFLLRRMLIRLNTLFVLIEDILFTIIFFFTCFFGVTYGNNGIIRFYMFLAMITGCLLYMTTIGRVYKRVICFIFRGVMLPALAVKKRLTILLFHFTMRVRERIKRGENRYAKTKKKKQTEVSSIKK